MLKNSSMKLFLLFNAFCIIMASPSPSATDNTLQKESYKFDDGSLPDLSCILFGNVGCQSVCILLGKLYIDTKTNICNKSLKCICNSGQPKNLYAIWTEKFKKSSVSSKLWLKIKGYNLQIKKKLIPILIQEMLSAKEMKKLLEEVLGEEVKNLESNQNEVINNYLDEEGNINDENYTKLVDFVNEQLTDSKLKNTITYLDTEYKQNFVKFMEKVTDPILIKYILNQVDKMLIPNFVDFVRVYLNENNKLPPDNNEAEKNNSHDASEKTVDKISNIIVEVLINYIEINSSNLSISNNSVLEKSASQQNTMEISVTPEDLDKFLKFNSKKMVLKIIINPQDLNNILKSVPHQDILEIALSPEDLNKFLKLNDGASEQKVFRSKNMETTTNKKKITVSPKSDYSSSTDLNLQFTDPGMNINPKDLEGIGEKVWQNDKNYIIWQRNKENDTHLSWNVGDIFFSYSQYHWKDVNQVWIFGDVRIQFRITQGVPNHDWEFGPQSELTCSRKKSNLPITCTWRGKEDRKSLEKYKGYIKSWCAQNKILVPKNCVLFNY